VVTIDIKGAFLKANVPEDLELIIRMEGELAELFAELNPDLKLDENGILYLKCLKALYGHIEAARLFYDKLDNSLTMKMNFQRNKYDPCVYNKETENGWITVRTHVGDLKISCKDMQEIFLVIEQLQKIYDEITVHKGDEHDYLGMVMTHNRENNSVKINMEKYIEGILDMFQMDEPDEPLKIVVTPATNNLFKTR
jgi:hypothetical protein